MTTRDNNDWRLWGLLRQRIYGMCFGELYHWPARTWPAGTMLDVYEWDTGKFLGQIEQAPSTYNVVGNMNEYQLSIGETTFGGLEQLETQTGAIIDYGSLMYITLQRAKSAREAIKVMHELGFDSMVTTAAANHSPLPTKMKSGSWS